MTKSKIFLLLLLSSFAFSSCDDFFNVQTEDFLTDEDNYKELNQIYSGMVGLATNFRNVMDNFIILSELRGDLLQPTETAPDEYWDIFRYKSDANNSAASPAPLYQLVANCNDFLRNLRQYQNNYPDALSKTTYRGMIAATISYRAWAYLNIGKLYGEAYYHDLSVFDMSQDMSQGKLLLLDDLVKQLISSVQIGVDGINAFNILDWRIITMDPTADADQFDQTWSRITVNPDALLTELFLWDGNYIDAAKQGILAINGQGLVTAGTNKNLFNLTSYAPDKWREFFSHDLGNTHLNEAMTAIQFDYAKRQTHDLQYYFSNYAPNIYRFRPTDLLTRDNSYDSDYLYTIPDNIHYSEEDDEELVTTRTDTWREDITLGEENGMPVVAKYSLYKDIYEQDATKYEHDKTIYVYRATELYLMIAEALTGIGNVAAADSLISVGFAKSWTGSYFNFPFDAPIYTGGHLSGSKGVLGRLGYKGNHIRYYLSGGDTLIDRQKFVMDSIIAQETARELAFEGKRWFTLVRMARNSNSPEKLANVVIKKFPYSLQDHYRVWLMEPKNWFMKWNHLPTAKSEELQPLKD